MKFTYASGSRPLDGYTIKRGIGHGGFGEVYYAVSDGGKEVAIKLVQRNLDVELRGVAQCMNLKHPNLVTLYDLRTNDAGEHFVVMEFIAGESLADALEKAPDGFTEEQIFCWLEGISDGVGYLHDKGIVHRDLKPGNLFLEDGFVKVVDYGLTKFITTSRRSGQTESVGTVHYMAPEISQGRYDREIDVYAAGIMLYEMLTGSVPFDGESVGEILMKHLTAQPDLSVLPSKFRNVVAKAIHKDPTARFRSMAEFKQALRGGKVSAPAPPPPPPAPVEPQIAYHKAAASPARGAAAVSHVSDGTNWPFIILMVALGSLFFPFGFRFGTAGIVEIILIGACVVMAVGWRKNQKQRTRERVRNDAVHRPVARARQPAPVVKVVKAPRTTKAEPLPPKLIRERVMEGSTGMISIAVLSAVAAILSYSPMNLNSVGECVLIGSTCLAGSWAVLLSGKLWEGRRGDPMLRRLAMGASGLLVGMLSSYLDVLMGLGIYENAVQSDAWLSAPEWFPQMLSNASYFGLAFMFVDWWSYADSRRSIRFNPWWVAVPCFWAWILSMVWGNAHPWGWIIIGIIAAITQLGSPWDEPAGRKNVA